MMKQRVFQKILFLLLSAVLLASTASAQTTITWTGAASDNNWGTAGNWSPANVPNLATEVALFNTGSSFTISSMPATLPLGRIRVENNTQVTLNATSAITVGANAYTGSEVFVESGSRLQFGDNISLTIAGVSGNVFEVENGAVFIAGSTTSLSAAGTGITFLINGEFWCNAPAGFSGGTGTNIRSASSPTVSLGSSSTVRYSYLTGDQTITPRTDYANILLSNSFSGNKIATGNIGIVGGGSFTLSAGQTFEIGPNQISFSGTGGSVTINGEFQTSRSSGFTGSITTAISNANSPTVTLGASSTITYNSTGGQTISSRSDYANVTLTGGFSTKTADGNLGFVGGATFTISGALAFNLQAFQISFSGTGGTVFIDDPFRTSNLNGFRGSTSAAISSLNSPTITLGAGSNIVYNATSGNQLISSGSYGGSVELSGAATKELTGDISLPGGELFLLSAASGALDAQGFQISFSGTGSTATINGEFQTSRQQGFSGTTLTAISSLNSPTINLGTSSTIVYYGNVVSQTVSARSDYANVILRGGPNVKSLGGTITLAAGGTLTVEADAQFSPGSANQIEFAGAGGTVNVQGAFIVTNLSGFAGTEFTTIEGSSFPPTITLAPASIVRYVSSSAQEISPLSTYQEIELSGFGDKRISSGTVRVKAISLSAASGSLVLNGGDLIVDSTINSSAFGGVVIRPSSNLSDVIIGGDGDLLLRIQGGIRTMRSLDLSRNSGLVEMVSTSGTLDLTIDAFLELTAADLEIDANTTLTTPSVDTQGGYLGGAGNFSLFPVGVFRVGSVDGINGGTTSGSLRVSGTRSFTPNSLISYTRVGAQSSGNSINLLTGTFGCNVLVDDFTTLTLVSAAPMLSGRTFTVNGSLICLETSVSGAGNFLLEDSGTLGIGSVDGLNTGTTLGNIRVSGTRTYNTGARILFCRNGAQNMGNGIPANVDIQISDSTIATANHSLSVGIGRTFLTRGTLIIPSGNFVGGTGGIFTLASNGVLEFRGTNVIPGQLGVGTRNLNNTGSKIVFNSAVAQTFGTSFPSVIQKFRKVGSGTLSGEPGLTIADSAEFIGGAVDFSNGSVTLNGVISGSGALSSDNRGSLTIGGSGSISTTLTTPVALRNLTMNRAGETFTLSQDIEVGSTAEGGALSLTNGTVRVNSGSTLTVGNTFSRTSGFINTTSGGGSVRFNDNTTLVLPTATFTSNRVFDLSLETAGSISLTGGDLMVENSLTLNFGNAANRFLVNANTLTLNGSLTTTTGRLDLSDGTLVIGGTGAFTLNPESFDGERIRRLRLTRNGNVVASGTPSLILQDLELNFPSASNEFQIGSIPRLQFDQIAALPSIARTQGSIDATSGTVRFVEGLTVPENTFKNDVIFGCRFEANNADLTLLGSLTITNDLLMNPNFAVRRINVGDSLTLNGTLTYTQGSVNVGSGRTLVNTGVASFPNGFFTGNQVGNFVINRAAGVVLNSSLSVLAGDTLYLQNGDLTLLSPLTLTVNGFMQTDGSNRMVSSGNFSLTSGATLGTQHPNGVTGAINISGTRTLSPDASYIFNALGNQNIGFPTASTTCASLTFAGSGFKTNNSGSILATAGLNINSGVGLNTNGFVITYTGSADLFNAGIHSGPGQIEIGGTTSTNITGGGTFATLEIDKSPGLFAVLTTPLTLNSLIQTSGQLSLNGQTLTVRHSVVTTIHNDNPSSRFVCGDSTGVINLQLAPINTLQNLTVNRPGGFMTLDGNLTIENALNLTNGSLALGGNTLTLDDAVVTGTGLLRGISVSNLVFTGANDVGTINFQAGFQSLQSLTLSRTAADTLTLGTPLTASSVTLNGGRLVGGNNLVPTTLNYFGGLISPAPSNATDVQISPAANGQFLLLPSNVSNTLSTQSGLINIVIENDVITSNLDFGNRTLLNVLEPRTLTVTNDIIPNLTEPVPSRVNGRLRRSVGSTDRIWYIGDSTRFRPVRMSASSGTGNATIRYVPNDSLPIPAQVGLSGVSGRAVRYWDIDATGGFTADIAFTYDASDFPFTFNESAMQCYHWTGAFWEQKTKDSQDILNDTIRVTGVSSFSPFLLTTTEDAPLPISLTTFTGASTNAGVKLAWETATEQDNLGFEIRRSHEGVTEVIAHYNHAPELRGRGTTLEPTQYAYTDARTEQGKTYRYVLRSFDLDGTIHEYNDKAIEVQITETMKPTEFALAQNFPNPFNPTTIIQYQLPENSSVKLELYDVTGRKVATLVNAWQNAGYYSHSVNASAYNLSSGMYFYRLTTDNYVETKKMMLVK
jgi:hypothetical protein